MKLYSTLFMFAILTVAAGAHAENADSPPPPREVTVFFESGGFLKPEVREIQSNPFTESEIRSVVEELVSGSAVFTRTLPATAKLNRVFIDSGNIAYLDFGISLVKDHPGGVTSEIITVASLVRTILDNFEIKGVQILVEGAETESLAGHLDISSPITRMELDNLMRTGKDGG